MKLIYCLNGVVVGSHDSALNIPSSVYGSGVRVIPYDPSMGELPRVGTAPVFPERDTRPYGQPVETPELLMGYAGQVRWETVTAGIAYGSIPANTDRVSQTLIANLAQYAATLAPTDTISFTQDGVAYQMTAQDAIDLNTQMTALAQQCRTVEAECLADLTGATPTILTYDDVEARFAGLRSKTLRYKKA
jgi:hypothetical protein